MKRPDDSDGDRSYYFFQSRAGRLKLATPEELVAFHVSLRRSLVKILVVVVVKILVLTSKSQLQHTSSLFKLGSRYFIVEINIKLSLFVHISNKSICIFNQILPFWDLFVISPSILFKLATNDI